MFTGIIEKTGTLKSVQDRGDIIGLEIQSNGFTPGMKIGDSISVNGVCLTAVDITDSSFKVEVVEATRKVTTISCLKEGERINLEKAVSLSGSLDGHLVQGHVDSVGTIREINQDGENTTLKIETSPEHFDWIIDKGSIAVEGISLTVQESANPTFSIAIIPHTLEVTNLSEKKIGDPVNLEFDLIGKYVVNYMKGREKNV